MSVAHLEVESFAEPPQPAGAITPKKRQPQSVWPKDNFASVYYSIQIEKKKKIKAVPGNVLAIKNPCVTYGSSKTTCKAAINRKQGKKTYHYYKIESDVLTTNCFMCLLNSELWRSSVPIREV